MKKILVTGSNGQLGKTLERQSQQSLYQWTFCSREELDITKEDELNSVFGSQDFDYCINCAAYTNVEGAEKHPEEAHTLNVEAVKKIVASCNKHHITLVHISTDYVFDGSKSTPYVETDATAPLNQYGKSKLLGEQFIEQDAKAYYIIRTSWLYSKIEKANFYNAILNKARETEELQVVNDQIGTPTNVSNLAAFIIELLSKNPEKGLYHFSDKKIMSWYDFAQTILDEHQLSTKITPIPTPKGGAVRPRYSPLFSNKKL